MLMFSCNFKVPNPSAVIRGEVQMCNELPIDFTWKNWRDRESRGLANAAGAFRKLEFDGHGHRRAVRIDWIIGIYRSVTGGATHSIGGQLTGTLGTLKATRGMFKPSRTVTTFKTQSHSSLNVSHETVKARRLQNWFQYVFTPQVFCCANLLLMFYCWIRLRAVSLFCTGQVLQPRRSPKWHKPNATGIAYIEMLRMLEITIFAHLTKFGELFVTWLAVCVFICFQIHSHIFTSCIYTPCIPNSYPVETHLSILPPASGSRSIDGCHVCLLVASGRRTWGGLDGSAWLVHAGAQFFAALCGFCWLDRTLNSSPSRSTWDSERLQGIQTDLSAKVLGSSDSAVRRSNGFWVPLRESFRWRSSDKSCNW